MTWIGCIHSAQVIHLFHKRLVTCFLALRIDHSNKGQYTCVQLDRCDWLYIYVREFVCMYCCLIHFTATLVVPSCRLLTGCFYCGNNFEQAIFMVSNDSSSCPHRLVIQVSLHRCQISVCALHPTIQSSCGSVWILHFQPTVDRGGANIHYLGNRSGALPYHVNHHLDLRSFTTLLH